MRNELAASPPPDAAATGSTVRKDRLQDLSATMSAIAALRRTLDVSGESQLFDALGRLLRSATSSLHTFVLAHTDEGVTVAAYKSRDKWELDVERLRADGGALLARLSAGVPDCVELVGRRFALVPMSANGRRVLGALCLALEDDTYLDVGALSALAVSGAAQLLRLRDAADAARRIERLRHEVGRNSALAGRLAADGGILRTIIDNMPDHIYAKDVNGRFLVANKAAAEGILGTPDVGTLIGKSDLDFYPIECGQRFFTDEQQIIRSGVPIVDQIEANVNKEGVQRFFSTTKYPFHNEQGGIIGIVGISRDVTARVSVDEAVKLRERAVESSQDGIIITCCAQPGRPIVYINPAFERITGFSESEAKACGIERFLLDLDYRERRVFNATRKDGSTFWCEVRLAVMRNADGVATHHVFTLADVSDAHRAEEQLALLAGHDALTGLPNRRLLMERLAHAVSVSERGGMELAVAFLDLDGLKRLNDERGHEAGDILLRTVAERVVGCIRQSDTFARLGGDEFVLVTLHRVDGSDSERGGVAEVLAKVREAIAQPIAIGGAPVLPSCSIGVAMQRPDGSPARSPEELVKLADEAMYVAKKSGRNRIVFSAGPA